MIFSSLSNADLLIVAPVTYVAPFGTRSVAEYKRCREKGGSPSGAFRRYFLSDHVPLVSSFVLAAPSNKRGPNLPKWAGDLPGLGERITVHWRKGLRGDESAFEEMAAWKTAVFKSAKWIMARKGKEAKLLASNLHRLSCATALLRACAASRQNKEHIVKLLRKTPDLNRFVVLEKGHYMTERLSEEVAVLVEIDIGEYVKEGPGADEAATFPAFHMPGAGKGIDPITAIKTRLPNTRSHLTHLRANDQNTPTDDPQEMGDILVEHYSKVWKKNNQAAGKAKVRDYLEDYPNMISEERLPAPPSADDFIDCIGTSNNSAAGPDGIPFSILRACNLYSRDLAECLAAMAIELASGTLPPCGFNHSRFYVLPKKEGGLVDKTRGLSVSNTDNRTIASVTAHLMEPAITEVILPEQMGFTPGREGSTHVRTMLDLFYEALSKKKQVFILLLDTRRAFDTLSHTFLHECLRATGFPEWMLAQVRGLLHEVVVFPVLAAATDHKIHILRGVKQGCPLSPFLFICAMNVLLWKLKGEGESKRFAFADDLALALRSIATIIMVLKIVRRFGEHSDLHMNIQKTHIVSTLPPTESDRERLDTAGWGGIDFTDSGTYLGVLFGPEVTTHEVFAIAFQKLVDRVVLFREILQNSSIHTKVQILNVFCTPIMGYLGQFYCIPYISMIVPLRNLYRRLLIPFNGGGFSYVHAITPRGCGLSLHLPLRDIWGVNMTLLGAGFALENSHGAMTPVMGAYTDNIQYKNAANDMTPSGHRAYGGFVLLEDHAPRSQGVTLDLTSLPGPDKGAKRRAWIYNLMIMSEYKKARANGECATSLEYKLARRLNIATSEAMSLAIHLRSNSNIIRKMGTPAVVNTSFRMLFNALPFDWRRHQGNMVVVQRPPGCSPPSFPCYMCGSGTDCAKHVFTECRVTKQVRATLNGRVGTNMGNDWASVMLAFPTLASPVTVWLTTVLTYQLWRLRGSFFATLSEPLNFETAVNKIVDCTLINFQPGEKDAPGSEKKVVDFATNPPSSAFVGFTDGSAYPSGETGAGITLVGPGVKKMEISLYLGQGDNNSAETHGLLYFFILVLRLWKQGRVRSDTDVLGFSDSAGVLEYLLSGWTCPVEAILGRRLRVAYHLVKKHCKLKLWWIRGHIDIPGNEAADRLAKIGATGTSTDVSDSCYSNILDDQAEDTPDSNILNNFDIQNVNIAFTSSHSPLC